ncbi:MAG: hypothetical protein HYZ89_05040 [Candidatus Omnitrophica bacterium]|nr:hypothetical protein [Candidatus Omnitrophota bacterium]
MRPHHVMPFLVAGVVLSLPVSVFAGTCALCRQALASGGNPGLIQGFYWSILLIAGVPLVLMGAIGLIAWRQWHRRHRLAGHRRPVGT